MLIIKVKKIDTYPVNYTLIFLNFALCINKNVKEIELRQIFLELILNMFYFNHL